MAGLPLGARSGKMLLLGHGASRALEAPGGLDLVVAMVAGLSERDPFVFPDGRAEAATVKKKGGEGEEGSSSSEDEGEGEGDEEVKLLRQKANALKMARFRQWRHPTSDALARLRAVGAFAYAASTAAAASNKGALRGGASGVVFCDDDGVDHQTSPRTPAQTPQPINQHLTHIHPQAAAASRRSAARTCCTTPPWRAPSTSAGSSPASSTGALCACTRFF